MWVFQYAAVIVARTARVPVQFMCLCKAGIIDGEFSWGLNTHAFSVCNTSLSENPELRGVVLQFF